MKNKNAIVTQKNKSVTVAASPFNGVKLVLAAMLFIGLLLIILITKFIANEGMQLLLLLIYSTICSTFIIVRIVQLKKQVIHSGSFKK